jgi:glycosyltransferase involved in cell wall biosynthesis
MQALKILVVSAVYNSTPPVGYGGIQRVVHWLVEALVRVGHDVTLLAPPRSYCSGKTVHVTAYDPARPWGAIGNSGDLLSEEPLYQAMVDLIDRESFDIVHDWSFSNLYVQRHPERIPFIVSTCIPPERGYARSNLVACSKAHARLIGGKTRYVYYGLPLGDWPYQLIKSEPMIHIAKIGWFKAQHLALLASLKASEPIILAGNIEQPWYFNLVVRPLLAVNRHASHIGEINGARERLLLSRALVQTPQTFDCFPLTVLESLACATPVIAMRNGGIPEQFVHGVHGFLCDDIRELVAAMHSISSINPADCRAHAETHFSDARMAHDYLLLYAEVIGGNQW